ncbi:MAG: hypothetical protein WAO55_02270 [Candidatus Manganitrophaceae bacterium]
MFRSISSKPIGDVIRMSIESAAVEGIILPLYGASEALCVSLPPPRRPLLLSRFSEGKLRPIEKCPHLLSPV